MILFASCTPKLYLDAGSASGDLHDALEEVLFVDNGFARTLDADKAAVQLRLESFGFNPEQKRFVEPASAQGTQFILKQTWYVPLRDPCDQDTDISLEACLHADTGLFPLNEHEAGMLAYTVDGLDFADEGYPLHSTELGLVLLQKKKWEKAQNLRADLCAVLA